MLNLVDLSHKCFTTAVLVYGKEYPLISLMINLDNIADGLCTAKETMLMRAVTVNQNSKVTGRESKSMS